MKRLLLLSALALFLHVTSWAYDFEVEGIYYNVTSEEELTVEVTYLYNDNTANAEAYSETVVIPETVTYDGNTYTVTSIGDYAFCDCTSLTSITIPNSVTSIGFRAFYNCTGLTSVTIPESVTTLGNSVFEYCSGLTSATIGNGITSIGSYAFGYCTGLTEVTILNSVTYIGYGAFYYCSGLTEVTIPNSVIEIDGYAFSGCKSLIEVTIPESVRSMGSYAFFNCTGLKEVVFNAIACTSAGTSSGWCSFASCDNISKATFGEGVTMIPSYLFYRCSGLTEVNYNAIACASIGKSIYYGCNISTINIGEGVTSIPESTFAECTGIRRITSMNPTPPEIYSSTFGNVALEMEVPKEALVQYALAGVWNDIAKIYAISEESEYYPVPIFYEGDAIITASGGDENGVSVKKGNKATIIPISETGIKGTVVHRTEDLTDELNQNGACSITVSEYHKDNIVYSYAIDASNTFNITVPQAGDVLNQITVSNINSVYNLKVTGDLNGTDILTIRRMSNLQILDLSDANIVSGGDYYYDDKYQTSDDCVGDYFFCNMTALKYVKLPSRSTAINGSAFSSCSGLSSISIPASIVSIANNAFKGCTNLVTLTIEDGNETLEISNSSSTTPFSDCPLEIIYMGRNISYQGKNNSSSQYSYSPFKNKSTIRTIEISDVVTELGNYIFSACSNLRQLSIGNNVTAINTYAFNECTKLTSLIIGRRVTSIGERAFYNCRNLEVVIIPESVTTIGSTAFRYCTLLMNLTIGRGVTTIGDRAFEDCSGLTSVTIPNSVTSIGNYGFAHCTGLTSLTIGNSVSQIGNYAFSDCSSLTEVKTPNSINSIGVSAFENCTELTTLTIGNGCTSISSKAFSGCTSLMKIYSKPTTPPDISSDTFNNVDKEACTLYVPTGSLNPYWLHTYWTEFLNIVEMDFDDSDDTDHVGRVTANGETEIVGYYTLDGKKVPTLQRGVNIIRYSDGTAKKVLVK